MKKEITVEDSEYFEACEIIFEFIEGSGAYSEKEYKEAKLIKENADWLHKKEVESHYVEPHYPNAPEGSIWDY